MLRSGLVLSSSFPAMRRKGLSDQSSALCLFVLTRFASHVLEEQGAGCHGVVCAVQGMKPVFEVKSFK